MNKTHRFLIALVILVHSSLLKAEINTVTIGIFPYASTSKLIKHHNNLQKHITNATDLSISLVTAKDFTTYYKNATKFEYDLIYSPPHLARFFEKQYGYHRVAMTTHQIRGVYIVKKESTYQTLSDLKDKTISMAPAKTIVAQLAIQELQANNLYAEKNITIKTVNTHNNAIYDAIKGDSDAAVTGIKLWKKLLPEHKNKLRELSQTKPTSGFIILAKPDLGKDKITTLQNAFLSFNDTLAGKTYLFKGFKLIDDEVMNALDFHAKVFE